MWKYAKSQINGNHYFKVRMVANKRKSYTLRAKIEFVNKLKASTMSVNKFAKMSAVSEVNLRRWVKQYGQLQGIVDSKKVSIRTARKLPRPKVGFFPELDKKVHEWVILRNILGIRVKDKYIMMRGIQVRDEMISKMPEGDEKENLKLFGASKIWCYRFKRRFDLVSRRHTTAHTLPPDFRTIAKKFIAEFQELCEKHQITRKFIINFDQVPRYYESEKTSTIATRGTREIMLRKSSTSHKRFTFTPFISADGKFLIKHALFSKLKNIPAHHPQVRVGDDYQNDSLCNDNNKTRKGNIKMPGTDLLTKWTHEWCEGVSADSVKKSFDLCGLVPKAEFDINNLHTPLKEIFSLQYNVDVWLKTHAEIVSDPHLVLDDTWHIVDGPHSFLCAIQFIIGDTSETEKFIIELADTLVKEIASDDLTAMLFCDEEKATLRAGLQLTSGYFEVFKVAQIFQKRIHLIITSSSYLPLDRFIFGDEGNDVVALYHQSGSNTFLIPPTYEEGDIQFIENDNQVVCGGSDEESLGGSEIVEEYLDDSDDEREVVDGSEIAEDAQDDSGDEQAVVNDHQDAQDDDGDSAYYGSRDAMPASTSAHGIKILEHLSFQDPMSFDDNAVDIPVFERLNFDMSLDPDVLK